MPLVMATLQAGLAQVFRSQPSSPADVARQIATEYDNYCKTAMAAPGLPVFTGAEKPAFEGLIFAALSLGENGSAQAVAQSFGDAVNAYWLLPPVPFVGGPATGVVTAVSGAMAIVAPLAAALGNTNNTEDSIALQIATQLDIATKTVLVTYTTPPPPAGPPPPALVL
jgi:hypothetical protein